MVLSVASKLTIYITLFATSAFARFNSALLFVSSLPSDILRLGLLLYSCNEWHCKMRYLQVNICKCNIHFGYRPGQNNRIKMFSQNFATVYVVRLGSRAENTREISGVLKCFGRWRNARYDVSSKLILCNEQLSQTTTYLVLGKLVCEILSPANPRQTSRV